MLDSAMRDNLQGVRARFAQKRTELRLEHDPEKWKPVFRKDHANKKMTLDPDSTQLDQDPALFRPRGIRIKRLMPERAYCCPTGGGAVTDCAAPWPAAGRAAPPGLSRRPG